ncbi:hypothetical protein GCM10027059_19070 [Myceligenerans halotolerans]
MRRKIITVGTSAGITISPADLRALGLAVGDTVDVTAHDGAIEVKPVRRRSDLSYDDVMARIDEEFAR